MVLIFIPPPKITNWISVALPASSGHTAPAHSYNDEGMCCNAVPCQAWGRIILAFPRLWELLYFATYPAFLMKAALRWAGGHKPPSKRLPKRGCVASQLLGWWHWSPEEAGWHWQAAVHIGTAVKLCTFLQPLFWEWPQAVCSLAQLLTVAQKVSLLYK